MEDRSTRCPSLPGRLPGSRSRSSFIPLLIALVSLFPLFPLSAQAYDVDTGHVPLLSLSLDLYNACFPADSPYQSADAKKRLIQADRGMDKGKWDMYRHLDLSRTEKKNLKGIDVFRLAHRVTNWHFYNPERAAFSRTGDIDQSFARLWQELREGFSVNQERGRLLFLGGLIHLVEDISVPAHTIPVYHGPAALPAIDQKYFRSLVQYMRKAGKVRNGWIKDPVDRWKPDVGRLAALLAPTPALCGTIERGDETPEMIRDDLALAMRIVLQMTIPGCDGVSWSDLWVLPTGENYFGRYNIEDGGPLLGEAGTVEAQSGAACEMAENDPRYAEFVLQLHSMAVLADLQLLRWADREISKGRMSVQAFP